MGADVSIDYRDSRESVWISLAPQSWLREHWLPIAQARNWLWVQSICDNTCQAKEPEDLSALLAEMRALKDEVATGVTDPELAEAMSDRLERAIAALALEEGTGWRSVDYLSIG